MGEPVGIVGVGLLGSAVAGVLRDAGHPLVVHDVVAEKVSALAERGARAARSAAEVARNARVVFTVLPTLESVEDAIAGVDGVLAGATAQTVILPPCGWSRPRAPVAPPCSTLR
ncbi:MAG: hypothetical protein E6J85_14945 [Deltaproteobacteria bacterium]|nr:MAG: hypothetical protein E6J85_14945 [Deltaproteobacteria bacterium]